MIKRIASLLAAFCALSACVSQEVSVTYNCSPSGAMVYQQGIGPVGTCPVVLKYNPYDTKISDGAVHTDRIRVVWISGTSIMVPPTALPISGHQASVTFVHPPDTVDYVKDENFGAAYDQSLTPPAERFVQTAGQTDDLFDAYNNGFTCAFDSLIESVGVECK